MDRRNFLRTTGAAAAAAAAVATPQALAASSTATVTAPAIVSGIRTLTFDTPWRNGVAGLADDARRLARRIEAMSGEELKIIACEMDGAGADLVFATENDKLASHAAFAFFAGLPGPQGLSPIDLDHWLAVGGGQMLWDDLAQEFATKPFLAGHKGAWPLLWSKRMIYSPADFTDRSVDAEGLTAEVLVALGTGSSIADPASADVADAGGLLLASAANVDRIFPFAFDRLLGIAGTAVSLNVSLPVWDRLSVPHRTTIAAAAAEGFRTAVAEQQVHAGLLHQMIAARPGLVLRPAPGPVRVAFERISDAVVAHTAAVDRRAARINASYMQFRRSISNCPEWNEVQAGA